jgi:7,8-dihydropterin-6-yl-methyl-4-(beta-D-ribofuranosyl)aminobenzene 5'-phosphate synthase
MKVMILSENRTNYPEYLAEHGLSVYIETADRKLLFDLGASDIFLQNAKRIKINLEKVDTVVISHGHYDHTEGVPAFTKKNRNAKIYIHEDAFSNTFGMENGVLDEEPCGIRWTKQQEGIGNRLVLTREAVWLTDDIVISGTIRKPNDFYSTETFYIKSEDGSLSEDPMNHEQFLAIRERDEQGRSKGVFVFSGCSHNGVIPCLNHAKLLFPGEKIACLLAGMHLYNSGPVTRRELLEQVAAESIDYVLPVHCTGILAICDLRQLIGERCIPAGAGDKIVL